MCNEPGRSILYCGQVVKTVITGGKLLRRGYSCTSFLVDLHAKGLCKEFVLKKTGITMEVGGWVQVSLGIFVLF